MGGLSRFLLGGILGAIFGFLVSGTRKNRGTSQRKTAAPFAEPVVTAPAVERPEVAETPPTLWEAAPEVEAVAAGGGAARVAVRARPAALGADRADRAGSRSL